MTIYLNRNVGQIVTLQADVNADATAPVSYQWYRNGIYIPSAVDPTYTFTVTVDDAYAEYTVSVQNPCGQAVAEPWQLGDTGYVCKEYACDAYEETASANAIAFWRMNDFKESGIVANNLGNPAWNLTPNNPGWIQWRKQTGVGDPRFCDPVVIDLDVAGSDGELELLGLPEYDLFKHQGSFSFLFRGTAQTATASIFRLWVKFGSQDILLANLEYGWNGVDAKYFRMRSTGLFPTGDGNVWYLTGDQNRLLQLDVRWSVTLGGDGFPDYTQAQLFVDGEAASDNLSNPGDVTYVSGPAQAGGGIKFYRHGDFAMAALNGTADTSALFAAYQQNFEDYVDPECV